MNYATGSVMRLELCHLSKVTGCGGYPDVALVTADDALWTAQNAL